MPGKWRLSPASEGTIYKGRTPATYRISLTGGTKVRIQVDGSNFILYRESTADVNGRKIIVKKLPGTPVQKGSYEKIV